MFTDTHSHMSMIKERGFDEKELITSIVAEKMPLIVDIGTEPDDLSRHIDFVNSLIDLLDDEESKSYARSIFHFSAGIWPGTESIVDRYSAVKELEKNIFFCKDKVSICAIGECGLDRFWNKSDENGLIDGYKTEDIIKGEVELFEMQIELAKKLNLPVIVHSRDAAKETYDCIKRMGYHNGVIHCYSYGLDEVKMFLDLGWYISFSGSITYAKKALMYKTEELVRYVPKDRLLLETDSPYLAPVPMRGKINSPLFVKHVYSFIANILNMREEELCQIVLANAKKFFSV